MAEIGTAYIQIEPTTKGISGKIESELGAAGAAGGKSFGSGFASVMGGAGKAIAGTVTMAAGAATAMGGAFVAAAGNVASYGDNIDKMSQKMGMSASSYQEWDAVMQHSGTSMETMKASMKTLANAAETGKDAFDELGISQEQIANMSQEQLFEATIAGLQNVTDDTKRTYLAGQLLGRGATELGALLNASAEETQAMRDRVHELGGVMSDDAVKAAAAYQDQLQDMQTAFGGLSRNMLSEFLPSITQVMSGLTEIFSGNSGGVDMINQGIQSVVSGISEALPQILQVATTIIEALASALLQNLPILVSCLLDIITQLITFVVSNLPMIITTAIDLFIQIVNAIVTALPQIIEALVNAMPEIIDAICQGLITAIPALIEGCITLVTILLEHLPEIIAGLIEAIPQIINAIVQGFTAAAPALITAFSNMFNACLTALQTWGGNLLTQASTLLQNLITNVQRFLSQLPILAANFAGQMVGKFITFVSQLPQKLQNLWNNVMTNLRAFGQKFIQEGPNMAKNFKEKLITALKEIPGKMLDIGKDIVNGLLNGIKDGWEHLTKTVSDMASSFVEGVKSTLKIGSPSRVFADEVGQWIPAGIAEGIQSGMGAVNDAMAGMTLAVSPTAMGSIQPYTPQASNAQSNNSSLYELLAKYLPIIASGENVNVQLDVDGQRLFRVIQQQQTRNTQLVGVGANA